MAQTPTDQNYYHHTHPHTHSHNQLPLPPQFRNPFDLLFDERTGAINYNYIRPYIPNQLEKNIMRRPRRTRTTFTSAQIAELEQHFIQARYLTSSRLAELSNKLALGTAQIKIWFKNRRRRHKIQTDQHKDPSITSTCDDMSQPTTIKVERLEGSNGPGPPNLQKLNLSTNGNSTPTTLTPSPTPTTPTANYIEQYNESLNQYYYNNNLHHHHHHHNQNHQHSGMAHHHLAPLSQHQTLAHHQYPTNAAQFFQTSTAGLQQQNHQNFSNHHQQQQHHHHHHNNEVQQQQQQQQQQEQQQQRQQQRLQSQQQTYHNHHQSHWLKYQQKTAHSGVLPMAKEDTDFNFNNSYYLRMSLPTTMNVATTRNATAATTNIVNGPTAAMSTNSEVYEPLTPKNDDSPSLCSGGNSSVADEMDEPNMKSLQMLGTNKTNGYDDACGNANSIINNNNGSGSGSGGGDGGNLNNIIENCTGGVYTKFNKLSTNGIHESNYQCTMDTFVQAYNTHRKTSTNAQFTYCFN